MVGDQWALNLFKGRVWEAIIESVLAEFGYLAHRTGFEQLPTGDPRRRQPRSRFAPDLRVRDPRIREERWEETVERPVPADVRRLLKRLGEKHGSALTQGVLRSDATMWPTVAILLNGSNVSLHQGLDTLLTDGDVVSIVPVVAGGR